ncbi:MAG: protein translocase subunit SecD, partial [Methyloprofundus sp.]|nr:protein translocase subunit SecD [Methyloprofundus sp.]
MQNHFPIWKNTLIILVLILGLVYSLPNLFGDDPSVQISSGTTEDMSPAQLTTIKKVLSDAAISSKALEEQGSKVLVRFANTDEQMRAADLLRNKLNAKETVALNLAPATPDWLRSFGADPMYLGLDLRGGVHFLLEVDMDAALKQAEERYNNDIRSSLRTAKIRYKSVTYDKGAIKVVLRNAKDKQAAATMLDDEFRKLDMVEEEEQPILYFKIAEQEIKAIKKFALAQNITTLRNRVNELGVSEPVIQQQGDNRIVVQLPGV